MSKDIWQQRYPEISFLLSFFPYRRVKLAKDSTLLCDWLSKSPLDEVEVIYFIGLVGYPLPDDLINWLNQKQERALVFVEDELGCFATFSDEKLILHPQIHFFYAQEDFTEDLSSLFPTEKILIFEQKPLKNKEDLIQSSCAKSAVFSDILYSHKIVHNVLTHFHRLEECFDARGSFKDIPAIICGAGPSLTTSLPFIRQSKEKALLFAGGSAITALTTNGIQPHFAMALDPNEEEFDRLKQSYFFEGPFLFSPRLHDRVFSVVNGPFGYVKSSTGGLFEETLENKLKIEGESIGLDLGPHAFSVTTLALSYAYAIGCNPIYFVGVDLAYTGGRRYAKGVEADDGIVWDARALEQRLVRKDIHGRQVETLRKWEMESECIAAFAKNHRERKFYNATEGGLGFDGIANCSLEGILHMHPQQDFEGMIHTHIQSSPLRAEHANLNLFLEEIQDSLKRCDDLCSKILNCSEKEGWMAFYQEELIQEVAYDALLQGIDAALTRILFRYYPSLDEKEAKTLQLSAKYRELKRQITLFQAIFSCKNR